MSDKGGVDILAKDAPNNVKIVNRQKTLYSQVHNKRGGQNKLGGFKDLKNY